VHIDGIASRDDAKLWIGRNQLGRRNLTDFQRVELALMMKPIIEGRARAKQESGINQHSLRQNSDEPSQSIRTDDAVADMAGVSRDTVRKVEAIKESAPAEVQQAVRAGDMSINLAAQVAELPQEEQAIVAADLRSMFKQYKKIVLYVFASCHAWFHCHHVGRSPAPLEANPLMFGGLVG
jgi:hypothetical protein